MRGVVLVASPLLLLAGCSRDATKEDLCRVETIDDLDPDPNVVEVELVAGHHDWDPGSGTPIHGVAYNGSVPGPLIVADAGDTVRVHFRNEMTDMETTVHWHGLRIPDAMDGVPAIQTPVPPGGSFEYEFVVPDPGFYWYHPHMDGDQLIDRGLFGLFWVRDPAEPEVDCDLPLAIDDAELDEIGQVVMARGSERHGTHFGNTVFANARIDRRVPIAPGGNVLLRIVNVANARYFDLELEEHTLTVVATDGGWVAPYETRKLLVAPGERYTVWVRGTGEPGRRYALVNWREYVGMMDDDPLGSGPTTVLTLEYGDDRVDEASPVFPAPTLPEAIAGTVAHRYELQEGMLDGKMVFAIDGAVWPDAEPVVLPGNVETTLEFRNATMSRHPMHLHGQRFQVVKVDGVMVDRRAWKDTVDVQPGSKVTVVTPLDNPGRWMFHCHILEHGEEGMMSELVVAP